MCLVTKQRKAKIAKKDITCYKQLGYGLVSRYMKYRYYVGVVVTRPLHVEFNINDWFPLDQIVSNEYGEVKDGYRYSEREKLIRTKRANEVSSGLHASLTTDRLEENVEHGLYEFLIPAGSEYFTDKTGLIVSNQIMLVNDINLYEK